jgi:protein-tyrosine phosphatase
VRVEDLPWSPLDSYFDVVADKIATNRDRGIKTLVHCVAGVSRSASLCIVYLMKHDNLTLRQAYQHVKSARPIIRPNAGFWQQMVDYERRVKGLFCVTHTHTQR